MLYVALRGRRIFELLTLPTFCSSHLIHNTHSSTRLTDDRIKPLHDGSFAVALLNKGLLPANATLEISSNNNGGDFFPATLGTVHIRDVLGQRDLGTHADIFAATVGAHDALLLRVTPL